MHSSIQLKPGERIDRLEREGISIIQSKEVFSFSLDAVLLADFADIARKKSATIVDLCSGNGAVSFLLSAKTVNSIVGIELQEQLVDMANRSLGLNQLQDQLQFYQEDVRNISSDILLKDSVDYITCNPPYFQMSEGHTTNAKEAYSIARHEVYLPLDDLLKSISGLLKMKGKAYLVHRPDRLGDIISLARTYRLEAKRVQFVYPKANRNSNIMLIELMKDGRLGGMKVLPPITVYNEENQYTETVRKILFG